MLWWFVLNIDIRGEMKIGWFCQNFSHFWGGKNRVKITNSTFACKYAILRGVNFRFFYEIGGKTVVFFNFFSKKWKKSADFGVLLWCKKVRPCWNFAPSCLKNIRPFFNKVLLSSHESKPKPFYPFYFDKLICQNFSHFLGG